MGEVTGTRFGAIVWDPSAGIDEAIRMVEVFPSAGEAISRVAASCSAGERWAVVEVPAIRIVASSEAVLT